MYKLTPEKFVEAFLLLENPRTDFLRAYAEDTPVNFNMNDLSSVAGFLGIKMHTVAEFLQTPRYRSMVIQLLNMYVTRKNDSIPNVHMKSGMIIAMKGVPRIRFRIGSIEYRSHAHGKEVVSASITYTDPNQHDASFGIKLTYEELSANFLVEVPTLQEIT